jgi:hypothetical protein
VTPAGQPKASVSTSGIGVSPIHNPAKVSVAV